MGRIVAVVNQKGGVGKTTVTLGLASAAQAAGHRVLVVDVDPQASTSWVLGVEPSELQESTAEVLDGSSAGLVYESAWGEGVDLLPASQRLQQQESGSGRHPERRLSIALSALSDDYDAILIDCPPSLGNLTLNALTAAQHALIVVEPAALGLRGITAVADLIDEVWDASNPSLDLAGVVINKMPAVSAEAERRTEELTRNVGKKAVWAPSIPQRVIVNQAIAERRSFHSYGYRAQDISQAFDALWAKLRKRLKD
jgi:MinD-like ATPase involved in chromosome partitioning or flagellar assembly